MVFATILFAIMLNEFLLMSLVVVLVPGAGVIYTLATALGRGFRPGFIAAFGCTLGIVPAVIVTLIGVDILSNTNAQALQILKYAGILYLLYMAWGFVRHNSPLNLSRKTTKTSVLEIILSGILINVLNPKLFFFFFVFLPQFITPDIENITLYLGFLASIFIAMTFVIFTGYAASASLISGYIINQPHIMKWVQYGFASAFVLFAIQLLIG